MNTQTLTVAAPTTAFHQQFDDDDVFYPSTIENYMPENNIHFQLTMTLATMLQLFLLDRSGSYVFGDIMFYYERGNPTKFVAPDLMICLDKENEPSPGVYKLWNEKSVPAVVIELASQTTWQKDVGTKVKLYEKLGVKEYFIFDPQYNCLSEPLIAYRLTNGILVRQEVTDDTAFCESLGLKLVNTNKTLRLLEPKSGEYLLTAEEIQDKMQAAQAIAQETQAKMQAAQAIAQENQAKMQVAQAIAQETQAKMQAAQVIAEETQAKMQAAQAIAEETQTKMQAAQVIAQETQVKMQVAQAITEETQAKMQAAQAEIEFLRAENARLKQQNQDDE